MGVMQAHGADWTAFMAANWSLHERIAAITPNSLARGVYVGTIRCVAELPVHAQTDNDEDAAELPGLAHRDPRTSSSTRSSSGDLGPNPRRPSRPTAGSASGRTPLTAPPDHSHPDHSP